MQQEGRCMANVCWVCSNEEGQSEYLMVRASEMKMFWILTPRQCENCLLWLLTQSGRDCIQ